MDPNEAATLLEDLADRALKSDFEPGVGLEAAELAEVPQSLKRADGRSVYQRHGGVRYARALGADLARLEHALQGKANDAQSDAQGQKTGSGLREDQAAAAMSVLSMAGACR